MMKYAQVLHDRVAVPFYRMHLSPSSQALKSVWMETKSFPAWKLNALFCWKFSSCLWSSLLPSVGKQKKIPNGLVTFHALGLHLVLPPEYYFTGWVGWLLFNQLHHPPSVK